MGSFNLVAMFFGVISPKIKIKKVRIPVAIPIKVLELLPKPAFEAKEIARVVVREEADRFTILLPIRIALSILSGFSTMDKTLAALLFPSSARALIRWRFTVVRAVSAEEKNADKISSITNITICRIDPGSNSSSPYLIRFFETLINIHFM
jgi:hypothetical protein